MNMNQTIILNVPSVNGRCVMTVRTNDPGYLSAEAVRQAEQDGLITILSENEAGYGRTTFVFVKN